jgi:hypothetical protein
VGCIIASHLIGAPSYISVSRVIILDHKVLCLVLVLERLDCKLICEVTRNDSLILILRLCVKFFILRLQSFGLWVDQDTTTCQAMVLN